MKNYDIINTLRAKLFQLIEDKEQEGVNLKKQAEDMGIPYGTLQKYLAEPDGAKQSSECSCGNLKKIAEYYGVSTDFLLDIHAKPTEQKAIKAALTDKEKMLIACNVTGLSVGAVQFFMSLHESGELLNEYLRLISDFIEGGQMYTAISDLHNYIQCVVNWDFYKKNSSKIGEIVNNNAFSVKVREEFFIDAAIGLGASSQYIYESRAYESRSDVPDNIAILFINDTFNYDIEKALQLQEYITIKNYQQSMLEFANEIKSKYPSEIEEEWYRSFLGRYELDCFDPRQTEEEAEFKKYLSELFKKEYGNAQHNTEEE